MFNAIWRYMPPPKRSCNSSPEQVKVFSVLMKKARAMGYVLPDGKGIGVQGKFSGATVLNAERGAYLNDIVAGLDFASCEYCIVLVFMWAGQWVCFHTRRTACH